MATHLLKERDIPPYMWDETINYALYILNKVSHKLVVVVTPFKAPMGHNPNVSHLRVYGSKLA